MVQCSGEGSKLSKLNALDVLDEASCDGFSTPRKRLPEVYPMVSPFVVSAWFVSGGGLLCGCQTNKPTGKLLDPMLGNTKDALRCTH